MSFDIDSLKKIGHEIGQSLLGGECIELIGDVGAGKTTLTRAIAEGLGVDEDVQSPSFTISRQYPARDNLLLVHYDFYRLADPGIMAYELTETLEDPQIITVIEWAETVHSVLPDNRIQVWLNYTDDGLRRELKMVVDEKYDYMRVNL